MILWEDLRWACGLVCPETRSTQRIRWDARCLRGFVFCAFLRPYGSAPLRALRPLRPCVPLGPASLRALRRLGPCAHGAGAQDIRWGARCLRRFAFCAFGRPALWPVRPLGPASLSAYARGAGAQDTPWDARCLQPRGFPCALRPFLRPPARRVRRAPAGTLSAVRGSRRAP